MARTYRRASPTIDRAEYAPGERTYGQRQLDAFFAPRTTAKPAAKAAWAQQEVMEFKASATRKETRAERRAGIEEAYPSLLTFGS